jgi:3D (Asp-Asp-Asp) domain-containing protein
MKKISNTRIDKVIISLSVILLFVLFIKLAVTPVALIKDRYTTLPYVKQTETEWIRPIPRYKTQTLSEEYNDTYIIIHKESLGYYYITAYCPHECGYIEYSDGTDNFPAGWRTASGEICHRADYDHRLTEPTTCAISRSHHSFGDMFYIEEFDRVFVAEDTGPGVQGRHIDLFYDTYEEMSAFPTGYYEVYSVWYEEVDYMPNGENILDSVIEFVT